MLDLRKENLSLINENRKLTENLLIRNKNVERLESDIDGLKTENVLLKSRIDELSKEKITLKTEITDLKRKIDDNNTDTFVKHVIENDDNCRHYTGFPSVEQLNNLYEYLDPGPRGENVVMYNTTTNSQPKKPEETRGRKRSLTPFKSYILTLCRFRRNFSMLHLAWLVRGKVANVSAVVITWLNFMYLRLASIPIWPTPEIVKEHMPESMVLNFPNVRAITDCFEIFTEVPSSLTLHKAMFSSYKNHTTVKCLVAIAPGGGFSFVSALYPGKTSDREMVLRSGLLNTRLWERGDECMADRGFTVADLFEPLAVKLRLPSFLSGREQLSVEETVTSQQIAAERVHVERMIQRLKCFQIFGQPIPLKMAGSVNQLVTVCAILCNLQDPIIAKKRGS